MGRLKDPGRLWKGLNEESRGGPHPGVTLGVLACVAEAFIVFERYEFAAVVVLIVGPFLALGAIAVGTHGVITTEGRERRKPLLAIVLGLVALAVPIFVLLWVVAILNRVG